MVELGATEEIADFLIRFEPLLVKAWCVPSAYDKRAWSEDNPAAGQSVATAIVVRKLLGGFIYFGDVEDQGKTIRHYYNKLESGRIIDLTKQQFSRDAEYGEFNRRYLAFGKDSRRRADVLMTRIEELNAVQ